LPIVADEWMLVVIPGGSPNMLSALTIMSQPTTGFLRIMSQAQPRVFPRS
jgi:hypothetical protein